MKNYVLNLRRMIGDEIEDDYLLSVVTTKKGTIQVPVFINSDQEDTYPKIVLHAFISFIPIVKGMRDDNTKFWTYEGKIQIDVFSKDDEEELEICEAVSNRIEEFADPHTLPFIDPYEWVEEEDNEGVYVNTNYDDERRICKYGDYEKLDTPEEVRATPESWCLVESGMYVNGDTDLEMREVINGRVFPNGETILERGFSGFSDISSMRELEGDDEDTIFFPLEYTLFYNRYLTVTDVGEVEEITISKDVD